MKIGRLEGKVAIVCGAGSCGPGWGNGKAVSVLFAREGASVFAVDLNENAALETKVIIDSEGGSCEVFTADVTKSEQVKSMVDGCVASFGRIDILVNVVGVGKAGGLVGLSEDDWRWMLDTNLTSMFLTLKHTLPVMEAQEGGAIVNISSVAGIRSGEHPMVGYSATKGGVNQLTQSVAMEYASRKIRVNAVLPGLMHTPMIVEPYKAFYGNAEEMIEERNKQCPTGSMGDAWDVAYSTLYLVSDEAKYVTGHLLVVDGGLSCRV